MQFKVGENIVFIREIGGGVIRKIDGKNIYVEDETGFERVFSKDDIAKIHGTNYLVPENIEAITPQEDLLKSKKKTTSPSVWEIDLHYDEIKESHSKSNHFQEQALQKQMSMFKDFYNNARKKKIRKLIVIHGFGKGILREELQIFLKAQSGVDFFDAPYTSYGHGAIQVEIKYKY